MIDPFIKPQDDDAVDMLPDPYPESFDQIMVHIVFAIAASLTALVLLCGLAYVVGRLSQ